MFREGLAPVRENGTWGYIDEKGKIVIAPRFVWAKPFGGGKAEVWTDRLETIERP